MNTHTTVADDAPRILIVDDELRDRELVEMMLTSQGYVLETARNGEEALARVLRDPPDLILLDVLMQGMDGYHVASQIKANPATRNIPVIMLTALDDRGARMAGLSCGAEDFLSKPLDRAELCVRVRNLLRLKSAYEELDKRNCEIAAALDKARDARQEAEAANAAKTLFLRVMSHELRTPLNAISGYTQLLEDGIRGPVTPEQAKDLGKIKSAARYLARLIDDVLTAEKHELPMPLDLVSVAVTPLLAEVEELCALQAQGDGLTLTITPPAFDVCVTADAQRLQQILLNLVTNAIKFTTRGGSVAVSCGTDTKAVRIRVSDTGVGIGPGHLERVFEPFVQINRHLSHLAKNGVGLGLAISRQLARAMHGDLTLQSTEGVGSSFTLTLPVYVSSAAEQAAV
jgi:signal transduction histidine kinase